MSGVADRRSAKVRTFVEPQLEPGEQVVALLPTGQTGPSPWFMLLTYLISFWIRYYAIAVTERRVLFVRCSTWTGRPKTLERAESRGAVTLVDYRPGSLWGKLLLQTAAGPMKLNVHRLFRNDAADVAAALTAASAPGSMTPPPPPTAAPPPAAS